jgi:hypothetical protein
MHSGAQNKLHDTNITQELNSSSGQQWQHLTARTIKPLSDA